MAKRTTDTGVGMIKNKSKPKRFNLHYHIRNCGDGSAAIDLHQTQKEAEKADEEMDEGWGEPCNGTIEIKLENGKLYYSDYVDINGKYQNVWYLLEEVK